MASATKLSSSDHPIAYLNYETEAHCEAAGEEIKARTNAKLSWIDYPHRPGKPPDWSYEVIECLYRLRPCGAYNPCASKNDARAAPWSHHSMVDGLCAGGAICAPLDPVRAWPRCGHEEISGCRPLA